MVTRAQRQRLKTENKKRPRVLIELHRDKWPKDCGDHRPSRVFISREFLVQEFIGESYIRLSINRTTMRSDGSWDDQISWDELQQIKREVGYGDSYAIEVYPKDCDIVNVNNMRHLWVLPERLQYGWVKE